MTRPEPRHDDHRWPSPPDPGDLSRRVAQRRAELHLSQAQVAAVAWRPSTTARWVSDPSSTGTRTATPSSFPATEGMTSPVARVQRG